MANRVSQKNKAGLKIINLTERDYFVEDNPRGGSKEEISKRHSGSLDEILVGIQETFEREHLEDSEAQLYGASKLMANKIANTPASAVALTFGLYYVADRLSKKN